MKDSYTLFTPGPVDIPDEVFNATVEPLIHHRSSEFSDFLFLLAEKLRKILFTKKAHIYFFSSSGTGAMEAAFCNMLQKDDKPIIAVTGKFGERWVELARVYNIEPIVLEAAYGDTLNPARLDRALKKLSGTKVVFTTLTETSTGVVNDIKAYSEITHSYGGYLVVDGVAGISADYCPVDEWNIDVLVGASQKALMAPPGVSFLSVNERAYKRVMQSELPKYYFNLKMYDDFSRRGQTPFTPAICTLFGLNKGIDIILKRGVRENIKYHTEIAEYARNCVKEMGLDILPLRPSNALTVIRMQNNIDSSDVILKVKNRYRILLANGQKDLKGKIIRIGHMGNSDKKKLKRAFDALSEVLKDWRR